MNKKVILIPVKGAPEVVELTQEFVDYDTISNGVEGWIESVSLEDNLNLWVNEEGKVNSLPYNNLATVLWEAYYGFTDVIMGPAVVTGGADEEGETLGLDDAQVEQLMELLN
jgi:hypothetical protein